MVVSCSSDEFCQSLEPASWPLCRADSHFPGFLFFCPGARVLHPRPVPRKDKLVRSRAHTRMAPHTGKVVVEGPPGRGLTWPRTSMPRAHQTEGPPGQGPPGRGPTWPRSHQAEVPPGRGPTHTSTPHVRPLVRPTMFE